MTLRSQIQHTRFFPTHKRLKPTTPLYGVGLLFHTPETEFGDGNHDIIYLQSATYASEEAKA